MYLLDELRYQIPTPKQNFYLQYSFYLTVESPKSTFKPWKGLEDRPDLQQLYEYISIEKYKNERKKKATHFCLEGCKEQR